MFTTLDPGPIYLRVSNLREAIAAAQKGGFEGVDFNPREVATLVDEQGADAVRAMFEEAGLRPASWALPTEWRGGEEAWRAGLDELPRLASAAAAIGAPRTRTWILPSSDELPFEENYRFHVERFTPIARILADHACRLGLEFVGPKTKRDERKFPFIYTMDRMLDMGAEIGPNVGLLLDSYHWYTSHAAVDDLRALTPEQVVYVHVNDAPAGVPVDEQLDHIRALPGETGVIDIAGFLRALQAIGYDGPVTAEPFKQDLKGLPSDDARIQVVGDAMRAIFQRAGLR